MFSGVCDSADVRWRLVACSIHILSGGSAGVSRFVRVGDLFRRESADRASWQSVVVPDSCLDICGRFGLL